MTASTLDDSELTCIVLVNANGEYSLWPACSSVPAGWREVGPEGTADACAAWVDRQCLPAAVA
ncbi:MAG: MbtH family NRPS accessory protein [Aquabacterium sp.]|nr:MbtH family NRPS accessory protein [Aquabacterium sp.]